MVNFIATLLNVEPYHVSCLMPLFIAGVVGTVCYIIFCGKDGL